MNSKDWKLGLLAIAAMTLLSACSKDKNDEEQANPFTGIWVPAENVDAYAQYKEDPRTFCALVDKHRLRFGDANYRVQAITVQNTGDILRYLPGADVSTSNFRRVNILGHVDANGRYVSGIIGIDGNFVPSNSFRQVGAYEVQSGSSFEISDDQLTVTRSSGKTRNYYRFNDVTAKEYNKAVRRCLPPIVDEESYVDESYDSKRQTQVLPKDCDPQVQGKVCDEAPVHHGRQLETFDQDGR